MKGKLTLFDSLPNLLNRLKIDLIEILFDLFPPYSFLKIQDEILQVKGNP